LLIIVIVYNIIDNVLKINEKNVSIDDKDRDDDGEICVNILWIIWIIELS
jgi:hypothetical protein